LNRNQIWIEVVLLVVLLVVLHFSTPDNQPINRQLRC